MFTLHNADPKLTISGWKSESFRYNFNAWLGFAYLRKHANAYSERPEPSQAHNIYARWEAS